MIFYMFRSIEIALLPTGLLIPLARTTYRTVNCTYSRLPEGEPSGAEHVADINIKILV
jgi:hypothetical protein